MTKRTNVDPVRKPKLPDVELVADDYFSKLSRDEDEPNEKRSTLSYTLNNLRDTLDVIEVQVAKLNGVLFSVGSDCGVKKSESFAGIQNEVSDALHIASSISETLKSILDQI